MIHPAILKCSRSEDIVTRVVETIVVSIVANMRANDILQNVQLVYNDWTGFKVTNRSIVRISRPPRISAL